MCLNSKSKTYIVNLSFTLSITLNEGMVIKSAGDVIKAIHHSCCAYRNKWVN